LACYAVLGHILQSSSTLFALFRHTFPSMDAAGPGRRVYLVWSWSGQTMNEQGALALLIGSQLLTDAGTRTLNCSTEKLELYWVVHPAHFSTWSHMPPKEYPDKSNAVAVHCWNTYVVQYTLQALSSFIFQHNWKK
jgi:hypothetical protein